jgi:hypothetical protein
MTEITISNGITSITMPRTRQVADVERKYLRKTNGERGDSRDVMGFRPGFTYTWDWVRAETIKSLIAMLRCGRFYCRILDVDGVDKTGLFAIDYPSFDCLHSAKARRCGTIAR